eukprot:m.124783 g.124783  ORF g.124783 m.124783 type:complete len:617 (+) comp29081_c0_seq1:162-2012(+)
MSTHQRTPSSAAPTAEPIKLSDSAELTCSHEYFVIHDKSQHRGDPYIWVDRLSKKFSSSSEPPTIDVSTISNKIDICGILGVIELLRGSYLVVITQRKFVGNVYDHGIWQIAETEILPFSHSMRHLATVQIEQERQYLELINATFKEQSFYFSYSYDLTHSLQKLHSRDEKFYQSSLFERADKRFCWNSFLTSHVSFDIPEMNRFKLPIMCGFVGVGGPATVNGKRLELILISRRSVHRTGTRFNKRGIDRQGNVANFVETEQIVKVENHHLAYVQTRGSIPLFWRQIPDLRYKPPVVISKDEDHDTAAKKHFEHQTSVYGRQAIISLIDNKGHESSLYQGLAGCVSRLGNIDVTFFPFDFHKECSRMRWDRLSILMDRVRDEHQKHDSFIAHSDKAADVVQIVSFQQGVFRSNCIDCLDRTNVVQNMLAKEALDVQLQRVGVLSATDSVNQHSVLLSLIHNMWADNADALSVQYAGSHALKTDYTRTGRRSTRGVFKDLYCSILRYYKNNFTDGFKQDGMNLLLGNYRVNPNEGVGVPASFKRSSAVKQTALSGALLVFCLGLLLLSALVPEGVPFVDHFVKFLSGVSLFLVITIFRRRKQLVNNPQLPEVSNIL